MTQIFFSIVCINSFKANKNAAVLNLNPLFMDPFQRLHFIGILTIGRHQLVNLRFLGSI